MRGFSLSFLMIAWMSCTSCCCGSIPTFGLWPELDEAQVAEAVRNAPIVVDHLCQSGETCTAVEGAEIEVFPVAWSPFTGEVSIGVEVEATCRDDEQGGKKIVCAGLLGAAAMDGTVEYVTEDTTIFNDPSGKTLEEWESSDVDWD